jgi:hypothetical protein
MLHKEELSLDKKNYELSGQQFFFGRVNLAFKIAYLLKIQHYDNLLEKFRIKKIKTKIFSTT